MKDQTAHPTRDRRDIFEAISFVEDVLVHSMHYPPELVVLCPTILDGLRELLDCREKMHRAKVNATLCARLWTKG